MKLLGKKAIIQGANRNIGAAIALTFAEQGADVCISYRSDRAGAEQIQNDIEKIGRLSKAIFANFSDEANVLSFFKSANTFLGGLDILVNNAGGYDTSAFLDLSPTVFKDDINGGEKHY